MKNNPSYIRNNKELLKRMKALYKISMMVTEDMFDFDFKDVDNSDAIIDRQQNSLSEKDKDILKKLGHQMAKSMDDESFTMVQKLIEELNPETKGNFMTKYKLRQPINNMVVATNDPTLNNEWLRNFNGQSQQNSEGTDGSNVFDRIVQIDTAIEE